MRTIICAIGFYFILIFADSDQEQGVFAEVARKTFADLLKTSIDPPEIDGIIHNSKEEEDLNIEDLSWKSFDAMVDFFDTHFK